MNVVFHAAAATGIAVMLTDTRAGRQRPSNRIPALSAGVMGVLGHGFMDYIPHCYPINSKADVIISLLIIGVLTLWAGKTYRLVVASALLGSILPDLIDLGPQVLHQFTGLDVRIRQKIFPWHWKQYSGSIYTGDCAVSNLNHLMVIAFVTGICRVRRYNLKNIFRSGTQAGSRKS
jgi:hypothetical protein